MIINPSSFYGNVVILLQALNAKGIDSEQLLEEAGIDLALYKDGVNRVPLELMDKLCTLSIEVTGDPAFGLELAKYTSPASYHALGVGLLYSEDLRDFCQRFVRFFSLISTVQEVEYIENDGMASLCLISPDHYFSETTSHLDSDSFVAVILKFIRLTCNIDFKPSNVDIHWEPPEECRYRYREEFSCEVNFGAKYTAIYFDIEELHIPFPNSNIELARQSDKSVTDFLARSQGVDLPSQVYSKLIELLPSGGCSRERVANALNMSISTFQKKLRLSGTSYKELLDQTRETLAKEYIGKQGLPILEVTFLLGFHDSSNFSRAFKGWMGVSPSEYRSQILGGNL